MRNGVESPAIKISLLHALSETFQRETDELIEIYLQEAKRKISILHSALSQCNITNFIATARELRLSSLDMGAIQFSHHCLSLEIAAAEMRLESLPSLISFIENQFIGICHSLNRLRKQSE